LRPSHHLPLRCPAPGPAGGTPGPRRCDSVAVLTVTMWHRRGCGAAGRLLTSEEPRRRHVHVAGPRRQL